jgi:hypothetical protein
MTVTVPEMNTTSLPEVFQAPAAPTPVGGRRPSARSLRPIAATAGDAAINARVRPRTRPTSGITASAVASTGSESGSPTGRRSAYTRRRSGVTRMRPPVWRATSATIATRSGPPNR